MENGGNFFALREQLIRTLGMHTVDALVERSLVEARLAHPLLAHLRYDKKEPFLDHAASDADPNDIAAAFAALNLVMLVVLARVLGRELARHLVEGIPGADVLEGGSFGHS